MMETYLDILLYNTVGGCDRLTQADKVVRFFTGVLSPNFQREEQDMKKLLVVLMAVGLFGALPALAAEHADMKMDADEGMRQCALQAESIQQKVARIQDEINKGSTKYSPEELKKLNEKLKETNELIEEMYKGGN
jgi:hypothetical protein